MIWLIGYLVIGFIIPFIFLYIDSKGKERGEDLVEFTTFIIVLVASTIGWILLWPAFIFHELKNNETKIKKFW
jgi:hypothetical protein